MPNGQPKSERAPSGSLWFAESVGARTALALTLGARAVTRQRERKRRREGERPTPFDAVKVNAELLRPYNSYGVPLFVSLGYYVDHAFACRDCGQAQVWRATQQKWWYEVAKGQVYSTAVRCRQCRAKDRQARGVLPPRAENPQ